MTPADRPPAVELHIQELVLRGFAGVSSARVAAVVQRELARLVAERGVPASWREEGAVARLDGSIVRLAPDAPADALGAGIARSIYGGADG